MDITGELKVKNDTVEVSDKFKKREFVLTDNSSSYPQHISFQLSQDKCSLLDSCKVGDLIKVHFNLRGRSWTNPQGEEKFFNTLDVWRIENSTSSQQNNSTQQNNNNFSSATQEDDLPF